MQINNLAQDVHVLDNNLKYHIMIESHLTLLRNSEKAKSLQVSSHQNYKYEGDFFGLLDDHDIPKFLHQVVLRLNGYNNSTDFKGDIGFILVPSESEIMLLRNIFETLSS
jgi:hypothetical protein